MGARCLVILFGAVTFAAWCGNAIGELAGWLMEGLNDAGGVRSSGREAEGEPARGEPLRPGKRDPEPPQAHQGGQEGPERKDITLNDFLDREGAKR
jgi:hypothetical protein